MFAPGQKAMDDVAVKIGSSMGEPLVLPLAVKKTGCSPMRGNGHFRSLAHQENRVANDRFQGTADVTRCPSAVTTSPNQSVIALQCLPASGADRMSAGQGTKLALLPFADTQLGSARSYRADALLPIPTEN
ncbi:hypothetical protein [Ramlibacter sp. 2FC]|uniref:hypothetical protein n=1 Tax=Ramlibacter sp. 2FC TaxID=2502188 RepID=UPI0010F5820B|nr:hypothetical protein [Ramlibacter sp. 2FC]